MDDGVIRDREGEGGKPLTQIKRVGEGHQPSKKALWGKEEKGGKWDYFWPPLLSISHTLSFFRPRHLSCILRLV